MNECAAEEFAVFLLKMRKLLVKSVYHWERCVCHPLNRFASEEIHNAGQLAVHEW